MGIIVAASLNMLLRNKGETQSVVLLFVTAFFDMADAPDYNAKERTDWRTARSTWKFIDLYREFDYIRRKILTLPAPRLLTDVGKPLPQSDFDKFRPAV